MADAKKDFRVIGLVLVACTLIFQVVPRIGILICGALFYGGDRVAAGENFWVRAMPNYLVSFPLMLLLFAKLPGKIPEKRRLKLHQFLGGFTCSIGVTLTCNLIMTLLTAWIGSLLKTEIQNRTLEILKQIDLSSGLIVVSLCAPIWEELIFRRMLITRTLKYGEGISILLSGLAFGLFHGNLIQSFYAFGLGLCLGYIFVKTGNVLYTIAIHLMINFNTSIILAGLYKMVDMPKYMELSEIYKKTSDSSELIAHFFEHLGAFIMLYGCLAVMYLTALAGVILLIVFHKRLRCAPGEVPIEKGNRFRTVFFNVGMILFVIFWIFIIIRQLLGI